MSDLVLKRNEVRQHLSDAIELFCKEVCSLPLQERKHSLEVSGIIMLACIEMKT